MGVELNCLGLITGHNEGGTSEMSEHPPVSQRDWDKKERERREQERIKQEEKDRQAEEERKQREQTQH